MAGTFSGSSAHPRLGISARFADPDLKQGPSRNAMEKMRCRLGHSLAPSFLSLCAYEPNYCRLILCNISSSRTAALFPLCVCAPNRQAQVDRECVLSASSLPGSPARGLSPCVAGRPITGPQPARCARTARKRPGQEPLVDEATSGVFKIQIPNTSIAASESEACQTPRSRQLPESTVQISSR